MGHFLSDFKTHQTSKNYFIYISGCPFVCSVSESNRVTLSLRNLELIPVNQVARFHMTVDDNNNAELAVSVRGN